MSERLNELSDRLEQAATQLRAGDLEPEHAAALAEECARLAAEAASELDRRVRAAGAEPPPAPPGQARLLP